MISKFPGLPVTRSPFPDLRQDSFFVGRSQELNQIITNLLQNRHTLIIGDRGIGKTRLMQETLAILNGAAHRIDILELPHSSERGLCLYIDSPSPLSKFIKRLSIDLMRFDQLKPLNTLKESELADMVVKALSSGGRKHIVFVDNFDSITPSHRMFLERLLNSSLLCVSSQSVKQQPVLKKIFDSFSTVPLRPLDVNESTAIVDYFAERYNIRTLDKDLFKSQIIKSAQGNPFQLKEFLFAAASKRFLSSSDIRDLVYSANNRDYFNMGPLYALGLAIFSLSKILSIGASNKEFYILMSSLGFLAYLVFRIFRSFFTLKPRKSSGS